MMRASKKLPMDEHIDNEPVVKTLRQLASAPTLPHIILYGPSGIGKTHLAKLFIREYLESHGISSAEHHKYVLAAPSSDDRGIKFIRTQVRDFAKECHKIASSDDDTGPLQIIFMDDCDTLPPLSQQALRRIMEQYDHRTAFVFVAKRINVFTDPIQSRCVLLPMAPVNMYPYAKNLAAEFGCKIGEDALNKLVSLSVGNLRQFIQYLQILSLVLGEDEATCENIDALCDSIPIEKIRKLIYAYLNKDKPATIISCVQLWEMGYPLSDVLNYIQNVSEMYSSYSDEDMLRINECIGMGSVMCIDNHVHLWDMISLFTTHSLSHTIH